MLTALSFLGRSFSRGQLQGPIWEPAPEIWLRGVSFCSLVIPSLSHPGLHLTLTGSERVSDPMLVVGHRREPDLGAGDRQGARCSDGLSTAGVGGDGSGAPQSQSCPRSAVRQWS